MSASADAGRKNGACTKNKTGLVYYPNRFCVCIVIARRLCRRGNPRHHFLPKSHPQTYRIVVRIGKAKVKALYLPKLNIGGEDEAVNYIVLGICGISRVIGLI